MVINHVQVNRAQTGRRRTYRAHGRINRKKKKKFFIYLWFFFLLAYLNCPCHIELWAATKEEDVKKEKSKETKNAVAKLSRKQIARKRLPVGH